MPKKVIEETKLYPVVLHREGDTWGYFSPDFGGGGASTKADALDRAREMIGAEIGTLREAGEAVPDPSDVDDLDTDGGHIVYMPFILSNAAERISLTLPKDVLALIDAETTNRSAFISELARERLG